MMKELETFDYLDSKEFQAIRMPYGSERFAMYVFLPRKKDGLREFLKSLDESHWTRWLKDFSEHDGIIKMPKFALSSESELKEPLSEMGMRAAFDPQRADFSGVGMGSGNPYISKVQHKTYIKVDESGTEAAAATSVTAEFISEKKISATSLSDDRGPPLPVRDCGAEHGGDRVCRNRYRPDKSLTWTWGLSGETAQD